MGLKFLLYIGILLLGIFLGYKEMSHPKLLRRLDQFQMVALLMLLLIMGVRIGAEDMVIQNLGTIGLKALSLSAGAIAGSIILLWIFRKASRRNHRGEKIGE